MKLFQRSGAGGNALAYILMTLTTLFWSGNLVVARGVRDHMPPVALAYWRWVIVLCLCLPFALPHLRREWPVIRQNWRALLVLGILGVTLYNTLAYVGVQHTTATTGLILTSLTPVAVLLLSLAFFRTRLTWREVTGVVVSLSGMTLIIAKGSLATLAGVNFDAGDLWMVAAVLTWGFYTIGLQKWQGLPLHPMVFLGVQTFLGLLFLTPAWIWELAQGHSPSLTAQSALGVAYQGLFPAFLSYLFYAFSVRRIGGTKASLFMYLTPVFGILLSVLFLGETVRAYHLAGIVLIFAGIFVSTGRSGRRA
ncbi:DMT family transporter [Phaeovibrio sulfidiphilus]|uniref:DMT family transporter n=1 Tax=Phaeovibrio sulfidiphilus TaxID=1220600 RepID=A0A8J6YWQ5_9PROT|nr:DMT family transporter [Phaeovibrio sulfidiphilus]MBE1237859.1 DMT family transporter [Phaeovibrio sulfidiphilus]